MRQLAVVLLSEFEQFRTKAAVLDRAPSGARDRTRGKDESGMADAPDTMILVIGDLDGWARRGRRAPDLDGFRFARFEEIDGCLLAEVVPTMVLSWLVEDGYDAVDVARRLAELGYEGRYRALSPDLPNVAAIVEEVREVAPGLDFDLFRVSPGA